MVSVVLKLESENEEVMNRMPSKTTREREQKNEMR